MVATLRNPLSSEDARNKCGKVTVLKGWRGVRYASSRVSPSNPRSAEQSSIRSIIVDLSQAWAAVSRGEVQSWYDCADAHVLTNEFCEFRATGLNRFLKVNFKRIYAGVSLETVPPTV